jgi:hypothetical protein
MDKSESECVVTAQGAAASVQFRGSVAPKLVEVFLEVVGIVEQGDEHHDQ